MVTDATGGSDTMAITQPGGGQILFSVTGRTFSVDGGALMTGSSGNLALAGINSITVNQGNGNDTANVGSFTALPSLTINGGTGNDTVNMNGNITFAADSSLDLNLQNDASPPLIGRDNIEFLGTMTLSGSGQALAFASQSIRFDGGGITTQDGNITVLANTQAAVTNADFIGVYVAGTIQSTGAGIVTVKGHGGSGPKTTACGFRPRDQLRAVTS